MVDAVAGGALNSKTPEQAQNLIEEMAMDNYQCGPHYDANCNAGGIFASSSTSSNVFADHEQDNYMRNAPEQQNNPYSSTYNPGWRNHSNFSWRNNNAQGPPGFQRLHQQPPQQQQQARPSELPPPAEKKSNLEELMMKFITSTETRQQGELPSTTEPNLREHVNAITLRSGRLVSAPSKHVFDDATIDVQIEASSKVKESEREKLQPILIREYQPKIPYPARLKQVEAQEQFSKLLDIFRQLHINLPFVDVLKQMPKYAKFLKDILSNKSKLEEVAFVKLNEEYSIEFQSDLPEKRHDPGSFTIPCTLGNLWVDEALADLGASINIMPTSMFNELGLGEAKPTRICIQLADHSVKLPREIVENMLVKTFPCHARAKIDVFEGKLEITVGDDCVTFSLPLVESPPANQVHAIYAIDGIGFACDKPAHDILIDSAMHPSLPVDMCHSFKENNLHQFETSHYDTREKGSCKFFYDRSSRQDWEWMTRHPNLAWRAPPWASTAPIGLSPCGYMPQAPAYNAPTFSICQQGRDATAESS
ncbi:uncharacterized protein LOC125369805 [Ricinus communis]|uniref:uncharacterized protein LOC125369805 n=1 Tax=Ricinus communis TaxID=3988 RepID=UPI00201A9668|nr:uncharacterized protein LOC125369805 [Ricinus communis]